jgi:hypothetical protein
VAALAAAGTAPVLAAAFWMADGVRGPVTPVSQQLLPAFVAASSAGSGQYRTLVLRPAATGGVAFSVLRSGDPALGQPELPGYGPAEAALSRQVADLTAPDGADSGDPGQTLGSFGIRWVLLPGPVSPALAQRLDAVSGLMPLSSSPAYDLWQVSGTASRARVIGPDGAVTPVASANGGRIPASGGTLVLAEPYGGWAATVNGTALRPLPAPVDGWAQGFALPKGGGTVDISRSGLARPVSLLLELAALLVIGVLAIPGRRDDPAEEAAAIAAVRAAQDDQRAARTAKTREVAAAAAGRALESGLARRVLSAIVAGFPPGLPRGKRTRAVPARPLALPAPAEPPPVPFAGSVPPVEPAPPAAPLPAAPALPAPTSSVPAVPVPAVEPQLFQHPFDHPLPFERRLRQERSPASFTPPPEPWTEPSAGPPIETREPPTERLEQPVIRWETPAPRPERPRSGRGAHRASRHAKPRGRKGRDGERG